MRRMFQFDHSLEFKGTANLHEQVQGLLEREIRAGRWRPGEQLPTVREVAQELGISISPVAKAFSALVTAGYLHQHVGRGTFLKTSTPEVAPATGIIGIVYSGVLPGGKTTASEAFDHDLIFAITLHLSELGYSTRLLHEDRLLAEGRGAQQLAASSPLRGILGLLNVGPLSDSVLAQARALSIPVVCLGDPFPPAEVPFVAGGIQQAIWEGLDILYRAGHRDIGLGHTYVGLPQRTRRLRYEAFFSACAEMQLSPREEWIVDAGPRYKVDIRRVRELLEQPHRPTAILCTHNHVAQALYEVAALLEVRIPEELSVLLISSHSDFGEDYDPPLSALIIPLVPYAERAVALLLDMLQTHQTRSQGGMLIRPVRRLRDSILPLPTAAGREANLPSGAQETVGSGSNNPS